MIFTMARDVRSCGQLVAKCAPNLKRIVAKLSMELGGRESHWPVFPSSEMEKALHQTGSLEV